MKVSIEMTEDERRELAKKHNRCPVCGFKLIEAECPPWMCKELFVSLEHTQTLLLEDEGVMPILGGQQ